MRAIGQNVFRSKEMNRSLVLFSLLKHGALSRHSISRLTKLTPGTITNITGRLIEENLITVMGNVEEEIKRAGRRSVAIDLNEDSVWVIGVHIRFDRLELGLVNLKGRVESQRQVRLPHPIGEEEFRKLLLSELEGLLNAHPKKNISMIGIGALGQVDHKQGILLTLNNMGWENFELGSFLSTRLNLPVFIDNNTRSMALAEKMYGSSKALNNFLFIFIGKGIGAGLMVNEQLYSGGMIGPEGFFGHMTYLPNGIECWCGNRGCLEKYASETAIVEDLGALNLDEVLEAAKQGDSKTLMALHSAGEKIAVVLTSLINVLHVPQVVIGGELPSAFPPLVENIGEYVQSKSILAKRNKVQVEISALGKYSGIVGAASLALIKVFRDDVSFM